MDELVESHAKAPLRLPFPGAHVLPLSGCRGGGIPLHRQTC